MMQGMIAGIEALFEMVFNLSLIGSYVILLVLLVRLLLSKAPRWCSYWLWTIVFLRLVCPVFPESHYSLVPDLSLSKWSEQETGDFVSYEKTEVSDTEDMGILNAEEADTWNPEQLKTGDLNNTAEWITESPTPYFPWKFVMACVWMIGMMGVAGYHVYSYWHFKGSLKDAVLVEPRVCEMQAEHLSFVMGIVKPMIYLSKGLDEESRKVVLCHEQVHLRRKDYLIKPLALGICCIHWFNPLVWVAFYCLGRDCEVSCDEKVVSLLGEESKKVYSYALLDEATKGTRKGNKRSNVCAVLSFGEDDVKNRIRHVLKYRRASVWAVGIAVIILVAAGIGLLCNPQGEEREESSGLEEVKQIAYTDDKLRYDIGSKTFNGQNEKIYYFHQDGQEYGGNEVSREYVEQFENGKTILDELEQLFPEGFFQYISRENNMLHINAAYEDKNPIENIVHFWCVSYDIVDEELVVVSGQDGSYRCNVTDLEEITFPERIATRYGWKDGNELAAAQVTAESALEAFAEAYKSRDGDTLYHLSHNKENFEKWEKVIPLSKGGYAFGDSSPWVTHYSIDYLKGQEEATIRFYLENSAPEVYIAEETVRVVKDDVLYYVDHVDYKSYANIDTRDELEEIYNLTLEVPFGNADSGWALGDVKTIFEHLLKGTNPEYYQVYTDPVTAAEAYLHLSEGSGEVTSVTNMVRPQNPLSSGYGEGTVVNVRYTFAKDRSTVDIPMVLAEESENVWALYQGVQPYKIIYDTCTPDDSTSPVYQATNFGLYCVDANGYRCIDTEFISHTPLEYYDGKLYFLTGSKYGYRDSEWMYDCLREFHPETGMVRDYNLPEEVISQYPEIKNLEIQDGVVHMYDEENHYEFTLVMIP